MTARLANITFDCDDALVVARFWSAVLDRPLADTPPPGRDFACIGGTRVDDEEYGLRWTILVDPEGNEFCVAGETS